MDQRFEDLKPRELEILKSVIRTHVHTGEPVGSSAVLRQGGVKLSGATIRNIMADLEKRGWLSKPHPSAGRMPTDRAYRLYVDHLMRTPRLSSSEALAIDEALALSRGEYGEMLEEASRQLSRLSRHVGVVLAPELRRIVVELIEFVRVAPRRVVAILVGRSGVVHNRVLELEDPVEQEELDRVGRYLSERYAGRTLPEMRAELLRRIEEERAAYDAVVARSLDLGRRAVEPNAAGAELIVEGTTNLLDAPEFADRERMVSLFRALEEKGRLVDLLERVLEGASGVQVLIGRENPHVELTDCSLVASSYLSGDRVMGTVGIVGPVRMRYARAVALVDHLARVLTKELSNPDR